MIEEQIAPLPIIPLSDESQTTSSSSGQLTGQARLDQLSKPKLMHPNFIEDKRSVYWSDPPKDVNKNYKISDRNNKLADAKPSHKDHRGDRPTPIWKVKKSAINAVASDRVKQLANPKHPHPEWVEDQPISTVIDESALTAEPSARIIELSRAKEADNRYITPSISRTQLDILQREGQRKFGKDGKVIETKDNIPNYVERLSIPKGNPRGYRPDRPVKWIINTNKTDCPSRVEELSAIRRVGKRGDVKSMHENKDCNEIILFDAYNGTGNCYNPYKVSSAALNAKASERIESLAAPIPRKMKSKKV